MKKSLFAIFLFMSLSCVAFAQPKICLNMIVKDEAHVIQRCLNSVRELIDCWVIVDTGSQDRTKELIQESLKEIPGFLYERPWVNFEVNRNEALELAKGQAEYILFMDADDWLVFEEEFTLPSLTKEMYQIWWDHNASCKYLKPFIVKAELPWKWSSLMHEYLGCSAPHQGEALEKIHYHYGADGARSKDPEKYLKAARILEQALEEDPTNSRYLFYLAESYRDAGETRKALETYEKRVAIDGWDEETFWALLQCAYLRNDLGEPIEEVIQSFIKAHHFRPHRAEPIYFLAEIYNKLNKFEEANCYIEGWRRQTKKNQDVLFNLSWITEYGIDFQYSITAYYLGKYAESLEACNRVIACKNVFESIKQQAISNRLYAINQLDRPLKEADSANKTVLIAILARNKAHVLPYFLKNIEDQEYDKKLISIYINTNNNLDATDELLQAWVEKHRAEYRSITFDQHCVEMSAGNPHAWNKEKWGILAQIRNKSLRMATDLACDFYFVVDCDNFISPDTLDYLVKKDKPIIAPLLKAMPNPQDPYSNFFAAVDENGYFAGSSEYDVIFKREKRGSFPVPLVHQAYLIKSEYLDRLSYVDGSGEWEFIIFSRNARAHGVDQYICNEKEFGTFLHMSPQSTVADEERLLKKLTLKTKDLHQYYSNCIDIDRALMKKDWKKALTYYRERAVTEQDPNQVHQALIAIAQMQEKLGVSEEEVVKSYQRASHYAPERADTWYYLAQYYSKVKNFKEAYKASLEGLSSAARLPQREIQWIEDSGLLWELSLSAHRIGNFEEALDAALKLLNKKSTSTEERFQLLTNIAYFQAGEHTIKLAEEKWGPFPQRRDCSHKEFASARTNSPKLHLCTYATEKTPNLQQLIDSCHSFGLELHVMGLGEEFAFGRKLKNFNDFISRVPDEDVVLCVDAYDVLLLADAETILKEFGACCSPCVFSAEVNCHPFPHLAEMYPKSPTKLRYLNSGSFIGYVHHLKTLFQQLGEIPDITDDQGWMSMLFIYFPDLITLDLEGRLFLPLVDLDANEIEIDSASKKVTFCASQHRPCVVHGNSNSKWLYQEIYNLFFKKM